MEFVLWPRMHIHHASYDDKSDWLKCGVCRLWMIASLVMINTWSFEYLYPHESILCCDCFANRSFWGASGICVRLATFLCDRIIDYSHGLRKAMRGRWARKAVWVSSTEATERLTREVIWMKTQRYLLVVVCFYNKVNAGLSMFHNSQWGRKTPHAH